MNQRHQKQSFVQQVVWLLGPALPFWLTIFLTSYREFVFSHNLGLLVYGTLGVVWAITGILWIIWIVTSNETTWTKTWIAIASASAFFGCVLLNYRAIVRPLEDAILR